MKGPPPPIFKNADEKHVFLLLNLSNINIKFGSAGVNFTYVPIITSSVSNNLCQLNNVKHIFSVQSEVGSNIDGILQMS